MAAFGHWIENPCPRNDIPGQIVGCIFSFQAPDMLSQGGAVFFTGGPEVIHVLVVCRFERSTRPV